MVLEISEPKTMRDAITLIGSYIDDVATHFAFLGRQDPDTNGLIVGARGEQKAIQRHPNLTYPFSMT
jgi:uncharacterized protein YcgI (DUF1989 family)